MRDLADLSARYDVVVIGGGVHGAAVALEATELGCSVLLVERGDFCSATSANSLRIIHGGLRYLQTADIRRSRESAREQHLLLDSVPHLVKPLTCLMGTDGSLARGRLAMSAGLWFYDNIVCTGLANRMRGRLLSPAEADRLLGMNVFARCTGAAMWRDAQVVDSERLVLTYLKSAERAGARILNYTAATGLTPGEVNRLEIRDSIAGRSRRIEAGVVVDTASFVEPHRDWARAANLILNREFPDCALGVKLGGTSPESGRLLFATPLAGRTIAGTWYFPDRPGSPERLEQSELRRCLADVRRMLPGLEITESDISLVHLGRLPVRDASNPLSLLEKPVIRAPAGASRVICVTGVKYTTAGPTARKAMRQAGLAARRSTRRSAPWYGATEPIEATERTVRDCFAARGDATAREPVIQRLCRQYGSVAAAIAQLASRLPNGFERIPGSDGIRAEIDYCIEHEYCRTLADFLLRRSGIGSLGMPPDDAVEFCAAAMAERFGWSDARTDAEIQELGARFYHA